MKLSELFNELETILDQHGDLEVFVPCHDNGGTDALRDVDVDDDQKKLFLLP